MRFVLPLFLMTLLAVGCSRGPVTFPVSGTVTYDGQPLPEGIIIFVPDGTKGVSGIPSEAQVKDGKFQIAKQAGVVAGAYLVTIESGEAIPPADPSGETIFRERFPAYGTKHEFAAGEKEYVVTFDVPKS